MKLANSLMKELNPRSPLELRQTIAADRIAAREKQQQNAWVFLTTGESIAPSPYGGEWSRDYNPMPYPEARVDPDFYLGTGIGLLYRITGAEHMAWSLAGWNLVRHGTEVRARRT